LGKKWAALVLLIDGLKGFLPVVFLAPFLVAPQDIIAGRLLMAVGAVAGHVWTPYAGFRGGKGVATAAGAMLALDWLGVLITLGVWGVLFAAFRIVSVASMSAALALPLIMVVLGNRPTEYMVAALAMSLFLIYNHRGNVKRLLHREEKTLT
jgi:glycerol-3-phosphate acyltransferase PlsY